MGKEAGLGNHHRPHSHLGWTLRAEVQRGVKELTRENVASGNAHCSSKKGRISYGVDVQSWQVLHVRNQLHLFMQQWGSIRCKHVVRGQHLSQIKARLLWLGLKNLSTTTKRNSLHPGPVLPPTSWWTVRRGGQLYLILLPSELMWAFPGCIIWAVFSKQE